MKNFKKLFKSYILYGVSALGISLTIIANVGVSSFNSMNVSISSSLGIKVGTITIFFNLGFLLLYMVLTKFKYLAKYIIQGFSVYFLGILINIFTYNLLGEVTGLGYYQKIFLLALGTTISGLSAGGIIYYNMITFPIESVCVKLSEMTKYSFLNYRYAVDIISVTISVILSLVNNLPLFVREGTIISMLILSSAMNISKNYFEKLSEK